MLQEEYEDFPEWAQEEGEDEEDGLPEWAQDGDEDEGDMMIASPSNGGSTVFDRMRGEFELEHAERRLHEPCPGCGRYPRNDQPPREVYSSAQQSQWVDFGCCSCYAVWQCSLAEGLDVVRVSGDLVWLAAGETSEEVVKVRLYNEVGATNSMPQFGFARHVAPRADSLETLDCAKEWLTSCMQSHGPCHLDQAPGLPTRVLDVSEPTPRLIHSNGLAASYAVLSHSWGSSQPLRTLKGNITEHIGEGIATESLPLTFQDAVRVARHLGIRYLWIDSLCIVQDDGDDWAKEAAKMADYYTGADVVIATSSSTGCNHGFLGARPESSGGTLQIPLNADSPNGVVALHFREALLGDGGSIARRIGYQEGTLSSRGWCYQERLLARRYLSFGRRELIWECNTTCHCESSDVSNPDPSLSVGDTGDGSDHDYNLSLRLSRSSTTDLYRFWMSKVVQHYAHRNLTRYTDRLIAIQGVVSVLEKHLDDEYVYGIWKRDALWGLSWTTRVAGPCVPLAEIAPSWSWASVYGRVNYGLWPERQWSYEVVGFSSRDEDRTSISRDASPLPSVQLRGRLLYARLEVADDDNAHPLQLVIESRDPAVESVTTTEVFFDTPCEGISAELPDGSRIQTLNRATVDTRKCKEEKPGQKTWVSNTGSPIAVWLLHLFSHSHLHQSEFLILGKSSSHIGKFQRIGTSAIGQTVATHDQVQLILESSPDIEVSVV
ncbi:hypothetical protein SLS62_009246 [Diatrype stigma]|uniref:Heterokaryon incompatibility domain-containing protein n=1 Tax=Diatrype stigma TaxID=117547 RepID=A0AAN9UFI0_9PEZI